MPRDQLAALVVAVRKRAGYTSRRQFSQAAGVPVSTLAGIERGDTSPSVETLEKIMDPIGLEVVVTFRPRKRLR